MKQICLESNEGGTQMSSTAIVWEVSENLYTELVEAQRELDFPQISDLITQAVQRYLADTQQMVWEQEFYALQKQVRAAGGFGLGETKEEVIANLRQHRSELFEAEYAHLY